jgi:hypothetical protein
MILTGALGRVARVPDSPSDASPGITGGRTYSYRDLDVDSPSNFDGYGSIAGRFGFGNIGVRLEARD